MKMFTMIGVLPDRDNGDTFTVRLAALRNLAGWTCQLPNGDFYHVRFSIHAWLRGQYPWKTGMGASASDARNRANGRPCREAEPPVRTNTAAFRRLADGTYPV
jgi:hypothetical protein